MAQNIKCTINMNSYVKYTILNSSFLVGVPKREKEKGKLILGVLSNEQNLFHLTLFPS